MLLSSSGNIFMCDIMFFLTHDSVLAKEDVDNSDILFPSVVVLILGGHSLISLLN